VALEIRPNCECCDKDLAPASTEAWICSFECTFCTDCVNEALLNVCPTCGGGFTPRPIRPSRDLRPGLGLPSRPAGVQRRSLSYSMAEIREFSARWADTPPAER
jgi:hypothetical protein